MLASFLHCHSTTETLNLNFQRGGAYARDKNTSARLSTKNAGGSLCVRGGHICGTLRYYLPIFDISMQCSNTVVRTDGTRIDNSCALIGPPYVCLLLTRPNMTPSHEMKSPKAFPECIWNALTNVIRKRCLI